MANINRQVSKAAQIAAGQTPEKATPKPGRRLWNDPVLIRQRVLSADAIKNAGPKKVPESADCEIICNDGVCAPRCAPAQLQESDLIGMSRDQLYSLWQSQAAYNGVKIETHHAPMLNNLMGDLKSRYSAEEIEGFGDLSNLELLTKSIRNS
jgi:hypothetical protein